MSLIDLARPISYDNILGNNTVKDYLLKLKEKKSIIFWGNPGCGKTSLARIYTSGYPIYSATELKSEQIRNLCGVVLLDELQYLDNKKQQLLLHPIAEEGLVIVGTTTVNPKYLFSKALLSRVTCLEVKYPPIDEVYGLCSRLLRNKGISFEEDFLKSICSDFNDVRALLNTLDDMIIMGGITPNTYSYFKGNVPNNNTVEELKSALQKSIRGSDPDASAVYVYKLLELGQLEILCRRLKVIVSEDIGLANPNAVLVVNSLIDNALTLGMPECVYSILEAVIYLAIQPKSNSVHEVAKELRDTEGIDLQIPASIKYVHSANYMYPHDYSNHWVNQRYLPLNISDSECIYKPCSNKIETQYKQYWDKIKRGDK